MNDQPDVAMAGASPLSPSPIGWLAGWPQIEHRSANGGEEYNQPAQPVSWTTGPCRLMQGNPNEPPRCQRLYTISATQKQRTARSVVDVRQNCLHLRVETGACGTCT